MLKTYKAYYLLVLKRIVFFLVLIISFQDSFGQEIIINDTIVKNDSISLPAQLKFNYKQLIAPVVLIGYGVIGLNNDQLELFNTSIRNEVTEDIDNKISIDDISQYMPFTATFGLEALGVHGKNKLKDKAVIGVTSALIMAATVFSLKKFTHQQRPDNTTFNSFPSGHTANAFMGAELLYQEYKDKSIWYGISGYTVATGTGLFRIYNNRHWLTDVAAGAGIGILSTKIAYWLYPTINKVFKSKKNPKITTAYVPYYDGKTIGFGLVSIF
ncbi:MAG: phosphatase PAP2 family protein [Flavobacterium sp.]